MMRGWGATRLLCVAAMAAVVACGAPDAEAPLGVTETASATLDIGLVGGFISIHRLPILLRRARSTAGSVSPTE